MSQPTTSKSKAHNSPFPALPEQVVENPSELEEVCQHFKAAKLIGFDTEFVGEHSFHPHLCLLQVSTAERLVLIDPFKVGPLDSFWNLLTKGDVTVIVHAGREEIRQCKLAANKTPAHIFDVQIAAGLVGYGYPLGYASLVGQSLNANLNKTETLTDWRNRPLSVQQLRYAFDDVKYLLPLHTEMTNRLKRMDRLEWAEEEFTRLKKVALDEAPTNIDRWRKIKGAASLQPHHLAVLRSLFEWRQQKAEQLNRPARTLIRDELLVELVKRSPKDPGELTTLRGLGVPRRDMESLITAIETGKKVPPDAHPAAFEKEIDPPQIGVLIDFLQVILGHLTQQLKVSQGMIGTVADLRHLVRTLVEGKSPSYKSLLQEGWRAKHIKPLLLSVLNGEYAVRVGKLEAADPLEFAEPPRPA